MDISKTCTFTGHRELRGDLDSDLLKKFVQGFIDEGIDTFLCGMAMGFDLLAAELILKLKTDNPHIKLIACVPCPDQDRYYPLEEKKKYREVLEQCDEVKVLCNHFYNGCMLARDRYMVDNCSVVIAYGRKNNGGTYYTIKYAMDKNKKLCVV